MAKKIIQNDLQVNGRVLDSDGNTKYTKLYRHFIIINNRGVVAITTSSASLKDNNFASCFTDAISVCSVSEGALFSPVMYDDNNEVAVCYNVHTGNYDVVCYHIYDDLISSDTITLL